MSFLPAPISCTYKTGYRDCGGNKMMYFMQCL